MSGLADPAAPMWLRLPGLYKADEIGVVVAGDASSDWHIVEHGRADFGALLYRLYSRPHSGMLSGDR